VNAIDRLIDTKRRVNEALKTLGVDAVRGLLIEMEARSAITKHYWFLGAMQTYCSLSIKRTRDGAGSSRNASTVDVAQRRHSSSGLPAQEAVCLIPALEYF
jgi:hypothetical protein